MDFGKLGNQWFALQVRTGSEYICTRILRNKGYDEFLPLCKVVLSRRPYALSEPRPLFPGYLFCRLNGNARGLVITTPGVIRIVGCGAIPSVIGEDEIARIRTVVDSGRPACQCTHLTVGERVRIAEGPLRGIEGILTRVKNAQRLVLSLESIELAASVEVDAESVISLDSRVAFTSFPHVGNATYSLRHSPTATVIR